MFGGEWWWVAGFIAAAAVLVAVVWRPLHRWFRIVQQERAREMFALQRERLEAKFEEIAAASGKPRGLTWAECDWASGVRFARDRHSGELSALVPFTVRFELAADSHPEDWPEVEPIRHATGVFLFNGKMWYTRGRAIFNLNPEETLAHFHQDYEPIFPA